MRLRPESDLSWQVLGRGFLSGAGGRAGERVAPPESPPQPAAFHIRRTERPQGLFIDRRGTDVRDYYPASGFKDTKAFDDRSFAIGIRSDVVDSEARDHEIEGRIRIRKRAHIPSLDLYAIAHTFEGRVEQGHVPSVARLILCAPDIDACHSARPQPAGDRRQ